MRFRNRQALARRVIFLRIYRYLRPHRAKQRRTYSINGMNGRFDANARAILLGEKPSPSETKVPFGGVSDVQPLLAPPALQVRERPELHRFWQAPYLMAETPSIPPQALLGQLEARHIKDIAMTNATTLKNLQKALRMEVTAAHQYQLHAHVLDDWGLDKLAAQMRNEMQEELTHSNEFINRIMFLKGEPEIEFHKKPAKAGSLEAMFKADLIDEEGAIAFYTEAAKEAAAQADVGTCTLFEKVLLEEEHHKAWLELQLALLDRLGEKAFSSKYVSGADTAVEA